jgi:hypothetical protein
MAADLQQTVEAFVGSHLRSVDDLQLLIRLVEEPDRWWDAQMVSRELGLSTLAAQGALEWFAGRNLVEIRLTNDIRYRFSPGTDSLRQAAHDSVTAYRSDPIALIRAIFSVLAPEPRSPVRILRHSALASWSVVAPVGARESDRRLEAVRLSHSVDRVSADHRGNDREESSPLVVLSCCCVPPGTGGSLRPTREQGANDA